MKKLFGVLIGIGGCFAVLPAAEMLFQQPMEENAIRQIDKFKTASLVEVDGVKCMHLKAGGFHLPVNLAEWDDRNPVKVTAKTTRCTTVRRKDGTVLLLIGNRGKAEKVTLTLPRAARVTDALSNAEIAGGKDFSIDLPQYGWKMLLVKGNK